jgi:hypothetical protein
MCLASFGIILWSFAGFVGQKFLFGYLRLGEEAADRGAFGRGQIRGEVG